MFQGYTQETVDFMWGIRFNNERGWFLEHKQQYQTQLLEPTRALGEQVYEGVQAMLPREPLMLKTSRIYRDARRLFGRGPYKDHLWFCVRTGFAMTGFLHGVRWISWWCVGEGLCPSRTGSASTIFSDIGH